MGYHERTERTRRISGAGRCNNRACLSQEASAPASAPDQARGSIAVFTRCICSWPYAVRQHVDALSRRCLSVRVSQAAGSRLAIWWDGDDTWSDSSTHQTTAPIVSCRAAGRVAIGTLLACGRYEGTVLSYDRATRKCMVKYDDGAHVAKLAHRPPASLPHHPASTNTKLLQTNSCMQLGPCSGAVAEENLGHGTIVRYQNVDPSAARLESCAVPRQAPAPASYLCQPVIHCLRV